MPHFLRRATLSALFCGALSVSPAYAQPVTVSTFEPVPTSTGLLTVESSGTLGHLELSVGLSGSYATDELLDLDAGGTLGTDGPLRRRLATSLAVGLGLVDRLEVSLALPINNVETVSVTRKSSELGLGDLRLRVKGRFLGPAATESGFGLALLLDGTVPTATEDPFFGDDGFTFGGQVVADYRTTSGLVVALNAGYRVRPAARLDGLTLGDEIRGGLGLEVPLGWYGLSIIGETYGAIQAVAQRSDPGLDESRNVAFEAMGALRWRTALGLTLTGGLGAGLSDDAFGAADYRVFFGVTYGGPQPTAHDEAFLVSHEDGTVSVATAGASQETEPDPLEAAADIPLPPPPLLDVEAFTTLAASDPDADADGVPIPTDACPDVPEDLDGHEDGDGCPDLDNDGDGVPDTADKCPAEKEVINGIEDDDGCPDEGETIVEAVGKEIKIGQKVAFRSGSAALAGNGQRLLKQVARVMNANPHVWRFRVEGHTDNTGDSEFNVDLSERRAYSVRAFLIRQGVKGNRLEAKGYGATKPLVPNKSNRSQAKNRRVVFQVLEKPTDPEEGQ
ncbi:MAG: outer membrane protein OmpA-like peptidoglycan-associated protein [Myxococcota bacterium]|jgi:outer membrane protein OmpA-like peptidoglycan-associated protein